MFLAQIAQQRVRSTLQGGAGMASVANSLQFAGACPLGFDPLTSCRGVGVARIQRFDKLNKTGGLEKPRSRCELPVTNGLGLPGTQLSAVSV
jgi:hypothetical protein